MAACVVSAQDDEVDDNCEQSTDESKVATHLSVSEQNWKQLNKALNAAASRAEKEEVFRVYLDSIFDHKMGEFIYSSEGEGQKWEASHNQDFVVLSALANKHGCMHIVEEHIQTQLDKMQPGSGLRMQPLDEILCANCTPMIKNGVAVCEKRGTMVCSGCRLVKYCSRKCQKEHWPAHKVDCKLGYAEMAWLEGSKYDMTAEDANAEQMPQIVYRRFNSKAIQFPSSASSLPMPCSACLAESGDLSDIVHTILSVPDRYEGEVTLHLNHASPNTAFCNLLSLLAMGTLGELSCDMLIQLWYSVAMTAEQIQKITEMYTKLLKDSDGKVMKSPYCASLPKLPQVTLTIDLESEHWFKMVSKNLTWQSPRHIGKCMEDRRKHLFSPQGKRYAVEILTALSFHQRVSWDNFAQLGMLLPLGAYNAHHNVQNPFLFDVHHCWRPEGQLDPLQCWSRAEIIAAGEECRVPSNDIYGALFFLIRRKLSECIRKLSKQRFHVIVTCCEPNTLVHRLQQSKTAMHYISGVDATQLQFTHSGNQELSSLSAGALKETIQGAGLPSEGCLVKSDLVSCAALLHGCAAPSNPDKDVSAADTRSPPTQQQTDEARGEWRRFIEIRASLDPPDILAVCYLAQLGEMKWMEKGVEMLIPECLALYGWSQLCWDFSEKALSALSHLQQAKDMKNAEGLLFWGLAMENAYRDATDARSEAWTCYYESACLGNHAAMFNVAHVLAARGDHKQAVVWWRKAGSHGPSLFELYSCYLNGHGCKQDVLKARKYLLQAADQGYGPACTTLSEWYCTGWENVLRKNPDKQAHWHKQATISSEENPLHICTHHLRNLLGTTNATPAWWESLRVLLELMERNSGGTKSEGAVSTKADNTFDALKFALEGAEKFMMEIDLTPSNSGCICDFGSIPLHHSFLQRAERLGLTSDERLQLQGIVQEITNVLTSSRVIASVEVCGSYGKGTAVSGCADLDMVAITVKSFESDMYLSLQHHAATLLKDNLKVELKYRPLAVSFTYKDVEIDVVLASPNIEPISQCYLPPRPRFFRRPSLSVQECAFLRTQPPLFGAVVRLLKMWRASAENWPRRCKPRSYLLELIALAAVQKLDASQMTEETVCNGFVTSLELLLHVISGDLKLYWVDNYPEYSIEFENYDGPIVMDPFDPTNNVAGLLQIQDWRPLSHLAEQTLISVRDRKLMQRVIHITPTAEPSVPAISPQYRFSCFILRAEQFMRVGNLEEALDALAAASQIYSSNIKLKYMWHECITHLLSEAKQSSLTEAELLSRLKDAIVVSEQVSKFGIEVKKTFARPAKAPNFVSKDIGACEEMDIPFSTYMHSRDEADSNSSEEEDIPQMVKLFPGPTEDELYTPLITSTVWKSSFKDGSYHAWLVLRHLTDKMPSKEQRDMYTRASLQSVLAYNALCVGKDVIGLDRMAASILTTAQTMQNPKLLALALTAAKRVKREVSSETQVLLHCGLSLQDAASIVLVRMHVAMQAWAKAREALKPLMKRDDFWNRADICFFIGSSLYWTQDHEAAMLWYKQGITADPTFRLNLFALGCAMIHAKSTVEADPEKRSRIMKTAEEHLWQYIKQGVPEDKKRCDAMYELVLVAMFSSNFQEGHRRLEMAIEADIRRTQIYNESSDNGAKKCLLACETGIEPIAKVTEGMRQANPEMNIFFDTLRKLSENPLLITVDCAKQLKNVSCVGLRTMRNCFSQMIATSFWSGDKSKSEFAANILKNLTEDSDGSVEREDDGSKEQGERPKAMQQIVVDCEGDGDFLSLGEALRSNHVATGTVITMKGGMYKEKMCLCIEYGHLTIQAESSKEKVIIQSYYGIQVVANQVTLSGLSVDLLSPKGHDSVKELCGHAIHVRAGTAVVLENCSATSATGAAIVLGDSVRSREIEVTMVMCNARSSVGNAIICAGSQTQLQLQQCDASHSRNGLEVRMGATAFVRSSQFSCNKDSGLLVWQHASAKTVIGPNNVMQSNQGSGAILEARGIIFHHNKVIGNKQYGVSVQPDPAPGFKDVMVKVEDCKLSQNGWGGVQFCGGTCGVISGCHIEKNNHCGVMVGVGVEKLSIVGNQIQGNYSLQSTGIVMLGRAKVANNNKFSNNHEKAKELFNATDFIQWNGHHQKTNARQRSHAILMFKQMAPHLFGRLRCFKCGAEGGPRKKMVPCVKCNEVVYCSMQCLKADADQHQKSCHPVPFYNTIDGEAITLDADDLQYMQAERENAGMMCANCDAMANKKCAACKFVVYCSKECQKKHWPVHKTVCKSAPMESCSKKTQKAVSPSSSFVSVKATTQYPLEAKCISRRGTKDKYMFLKTYMDPHGDVAIVDPVNKFPLLSDSEPMVIKVQGNEDDLIKKNTFLQFYNEDRSVSGWIQASMNTTGEFKDAYTLICDTIMQFGDPGRLGGKKGYFYAIVQRDMEVKVNCGNLVAGNIEW